MKYVLLEPGRDTERGDIFIWRRAVSLEGLDRIYGEFIDRNRQFGSEDGFALQHSDHFVVWGWGGLSISRILGKLNDRMIQSCSGSQFLLYLLLEYQLCVFRPTEKLEDDFDGLTAEDVLLNEKGPVQYQYSTLVFDRPTR